MAGEASDLEERVRDLERRADRDWAWLHRLEVWLGSLGQSLGLAARSPGRRRGGPDAVAYVCTTIYGPGGSYPPTSAPQGPFKVLIYDPTDPINRYLDAVDNIGISHPPAGTWVLVSDLGGEKYAMQYDGGG